MSNYRKCLIAFQTWFVNSLILYCTLPPRRIKAYKGLFKFHCLQIRRDFLVSFFPHSDSLKWPLLLREVEALPLSPCFKLPGSVCTVKEKGGLARRGVGKGYCPAHATRAKDSPRELPSTQHWSPHVDFAAHGITSTHFLISEILPFCGFWPYFRGKTGSVRRN